MKKILAILFIFCQFSFFVEAFDEIDEFKETIKSKNFYAIGYEDVFFEIGSLYSLYNKDNYGIMIGMGFETKYKKSYITFQNCFDLVYCDLDYCKNNFDLRWAPSFFLGNSIIKIGIGTPLGIGGCIYEGNTYLSISEGVRPSIKLTIKNISFEAYYQYLIKGILSSDITIDSNEFGLILKISTYTNICWNGKHW